MSYSVARVNLESQSTSSHESISSQPRVKSKFFFFSFFSIGKKLFRYVLSTKRTINNRLTLVQRDRATPFCYYICTQKILGSWFCAQSPNRAKNGVCMGWYSVCIILSRPRSRLLASIFIYLQWKEKCRLSW